MSIKTISLLLIILTVFQSCSSQVKNKETQTTSVTKGKKVTELPKNIWQIYQDQKNNYWFGSNGSGIYQYNGKTITQFTTEDGLIDDQIRGIQSDKLGNVFIETPKGVSKYDGKSFATLKPITTNKWILEPNDLWFNCNSNAQEVCRYDGDSLYELSLPRTNLNEAFGIPVSGLDFKDMNYNPYGVYGLDKDKEGNLWIGTLLAGAFRFDGKSFLHITEKELTTLPNGGVPGVRSILQDKNGYYWLSNFLNKYSINKDDSSYAKLKGVDLTKEHLRDRVGYFNSGLADEQGNLWMTTYTGGVWKYDGDELINIPIYDGQTEVLLISIYFDYKGIFWLGTDNAGVLKFNGENYEKFEPWKIARHYKETKQTNISTISSVKTANYLDTITVSSGKELIENIKSNRLIKLSKGNYNLPSTLVIDNINNLKIASTMPSVLTINEHNFTVLELLHCNNIVLDNLHIGHSDHNTHDSESGILSIKQCSNINVSNCKLIPGRTFGLVTYDVRNMAFSNSEITDCRAILFELEKSQNIIFSNAKFHDNSLGVSVLGGFTNSTKDVTFSHCEFINNIPDIQGNPVFNFMENWKDFDDKIVFEHCTFTNNKGYKWIGDKIKLVECKFDPSDFVGFEGE